MWLSNIYYKYCKVCEQPLEHNCNMSKVYLKPPWASCLT